MAQFTDDVTVVNRLSGRVHEWELREPMSYRLLDSDEGEVVNVPPRFTTDFASVPRVFWFWLAPWGRHGRAAIVHDFLYQLGSVTDLGAGTLRRPSKGESDRIFLDAMGVLDRLILPHTSPWRHLPSPFMQVRLGLARIRSWIMWAAVACFGHWAYKRQQDKGTSPPLEHEMLEDVVRMQAATASPAGDQASATGA